MNTKQLCSLLAAGALTAGVTLAALPGVAGADTPTPATPARSLDVAKARCTAAIDVRLADLTKLGDMPEVAAWGGFALNASQLDGLPPGAAPIITIGDDWFTTQDGGRQLRVVPAATRRLVELHIGVDDPDELVLISVVAGEGDEQNE